MHTVILVLATISAALEALVANMHVCVSDQVSKCIFGCKVRRERKEGKKGGKERREREEGRRKGESWKEGKKCTILSFIV